MLPERIAPCSRDMTGALDCWIQQIARGEKSALASLYNQTCSSVYGFALSICKNVPDAEDVLQDTYLHVWQAADSYLSHGKPMAWLLTITRNLANSRLRDRGRTSLLDPEEWLEQLAEIPGLPQEDRLLLEALLGGLPDQDRQILLLHALTGFKHREIAELLELPLPTVLSKYHRAVKKLRTQWKEMD